MGLGVALERESSRPLPATGRGDLCLESRTKLPGLAPLLVCQPCHIQNIVLLLASSVFVSFLSNSFAAGHIRQRNKVTLFKANNSSISWNEETITFPDLNLHKAE